jgi:hypothetical protein
MRDSLYLGQIFCQPSSPCHLFAQGGAGELGWLGPSMCSILANVGAWAWDRGGQPLQITNLHLFYILSSMFRGLCIHNLFSPHQLGAPFPYPHRSYQYLYPSTQKALPNLDHTERPSLSIIVPHKPKTYLKDEASPYTVLTTDPLIPITFSFYRCVGGGGFSLWKHLKTQIFSIFIKTVCILTMTI